MNDTTIKDILPIQIIFDAGTQARTETDLKTCEAYIESMKNGVEFPPLDVFSDGTSDKYILADGFHRLQSHISFRPNEPIKCRVHLGTASDARVFAAGANATHGLRRTNEDKRKAVKIVLLEPQCMTWSDRMIAEHVHVSNHTVGNIRAKLESTVKFSQSSKRIGKDGRVINTSNIGRRTHLDEPAEPESTMRTNADGKTVNVRGFDFKAHRRCDECEMWDRETGFCGRDDSPQPSWTPACSDWVKRNNDVTEFREPFVECLKTAATPETSRKNAKKSQYVCEKHVKCKLYPTNPQLSAVEIRHTLGPEYLIELKNAITTLLTDE